MFDFSFENIIHSNIINFAILFVIIVYVVIKINVRGIIESQRQKVEEQVNNAIATKEKAQSRLKDAEQEIERLHEIIDDIRDSAAKSLILLEEKITKDAKEAVGQLEKNAEKVINLEADKVQGKLIKGASQAAVKLAEANMQQILSTNKELHAKYIQEAIDELDKVEL